MFAQDRSEEELRAIFQRATHTSERPWGQRAWRGARAGKQQSNRPRSLLKRQRQSEEGFAHRQVGDQAGRYAFPQYARGAPIAETSADHPQGLAKDHAHNISPCCTERHANADLMCAPRDRVRE